MAMEDLPTFDAPSQFSDVVLVVEGRRFYVNKVILCTWSPVFNTMFTSAFKERSSSEIPLPQKNACDILEMLQVLYPPEKPIDSSNVETILCLAREYQMQTITKRCEMFLLTTKFDLNTLLLADIFQLRDLLAVAAKQLANKSLVAQRIWQDKRFTELGAAARLAVVEERLQTVCKSGQKMEQLIKDILGIVSKENLCGEHKDFYYSPFAAFNYSDFSRRLRNVLTCHLCKIITLRHRRLYTSASQLLEFGELSI